MAAPSTEVLAGGVESAALAAPAPVGGASRAATRPRAMALGAGMVAVGIGLLFVATMALDHQGGLLRWLVALAGLLCAMRGADLAAKARFGPKAQVGLWLAFFWVGLVIVLAVIAPLLPLQHPGYLPLATPSYIRPDLFHTYPLGTDANGRDVLARLVYGARVSLLIGLGCTAVAMAVGTALGIAAATYKGSSDLVIRVVADTILAFPPLVFLLALVAVLRPSLSTLFMAFCVLAIPTLIRLSRATALRLFETDYVTAARSLGATRVRIMVKELLPGVLRVLVPYAMVIVASLIVAEASLSFLGLGIPAPNPTWGNMIANSQNVLQQDPQGVLVPAIVLFMTVVAFNRLGEGARTKLDTKGSALG